ncbi:hypothetical protein [Methylobacterium sp. Leaf87]|uniref:hypothetical protein n=1 Tax=Methylobacterium sp. Leaf87 TaxID=1736243 RepID=UPI000A5A1E0E|nr:hypothetical protein [Methylobacterium sp. Leaf87]
MASLMPFMLKVQGVKTIVFAPEPDTAAGNAQFFDPDPACLIQLRPLLKADFGSWERQPKGNSLLYARTEDPAVPHIVAYVRVPLHLRKNTRAGVMAGIKRVERFDQPTAARLRDIAARTRWPSTA